MTIRPIEGADAPGFLRLLLALDRETETMMLEPGERSQTVEDIRALVGEAGRTGSLLLLAEAGGEPVGYLSAERSPYRRARHTAHITVGVVEDHRGRGVGTALFAALDEWAGQNGVSRLELTVMTHNRAAMALYQKCGFAVEGTRARSMRVGGRYVDEYYMAKIDGESPARPLDSGARMW